MSFHTSSMVSAFCWAWQRRLLEGGNIEGDGEVEDDFEDIDDETFRRLFVLSL